MFEKNKRGRRVKHYGHQFYSRRQRVKHILGLLCAIVLVFGVGWFAGPHILDFGTGLWYGVIHPKPASSQSESQTPASSQPQPQATPEPEITAVPEEMQPTSAVVEGRWTTVNLSALGSPEAIQAAAANAAAEGVSYALITLKDTSGYIYYPSAVAAASGSIAASTVDAAAVAEAFKAAGVTPVACLSAFRDPLAPYTDRSMGIHYAGSDYMWLDNAADAGGKPWLNPYSDGAVQFVGDLIEEAASLGYDHVVLTTVQFPAQVSAKQDFGATGGLNRGQVLQKDIAVWQSRFAGRVTLWFEYDYAACQTAGTALDAVPSALGVENLLLRMPAPAAESEAGVDEAALEGVVQAMKNGGCAYVVVREGSTAEFR